MSLDRLIELIHRIRKTRFGRMPAVRARLFFERLPGCLFRILLWRIVRKANHPNPPLLFKPLLDLFMDQMRRTVEPDDNLATAVLRHHHLKPANRRIGILKIYRERRHLFAGSQMHRAVDILGVLAPRRLRHLRLLAAPTPALADRALQINPRLIAGQRNHARARSRKFFENLKGFSLEAQLIFGRTPMVERATALATEVEGAQNLATAALAIADIEAFFNQLDDGANGPPTAHLRARHAFLVEQR